MKTCVIHIGMHKTGTSTLQAALKGYNDGSTHFANLGQANHSVPLITLFADQPETYGIHRQWGRSPEQIARMKADFARKLDATISATNERMILSGEGLSLRLRPREVAAMVQFLRARFDRIEVVAYVRDFASFAVSSFQQRVKSGLNSLEVTKIVYKHRFQGWLDATGTGEVTFLPYAGSTVDDFFSRYDLTKPETPALTQNESLSAPALALLFAYNHAVGKVLGTKQKAVAYKALISFLRTIKGERFSFSPNLFEEALTENAAQIAWMEKVSGFSLKGELKPQHHVFGSAEDVLELARESRSLVDPANRDGARLLAALQSL